MKDSDNQLSSADIAILSAVIETADISNASQFANYADSDICRWKESTARAKFAQAKKAGQIVTNSSGFYQLAG